MVHLYVQVSSDEAQCMSGPTGGKILVTGALGQIGTELVEALRKQHGSSSVIASDLRPVEQVDLSQGPYLTLDVSILKRSSMCVRKKALVQSIT